MVEQALTKGIGHDKLQIRHCGVRHRRTGGGAFRSGSKEAQIKQPQHKRAGSDLWQLGRDRGTAKAVLRIIGSDGRHRHGAIDWNI